MMLGRFWIKSNILIEAYANLHNLWIKRFAIHESPSTIHAELFVYWGVR